MPLSVCQWPTFILLARLTSAAEPEVRKKREYKDMEHGEKAQDLHAKVDMSTVSHSLPELHKC